MTMRRQALRSRAPLATYFFFSLILAFLFTLPSIFARAQDAQPGKAALVHPGDMNTKAWTAGLKIADATDGGGVAKLWARSKIASLEAKAYTDPNAQGHRQGDRDGRTRSPSRIEPDEPRRHRQGQSRPDGEGVSSVDMPLNLPDGWVYDKVFGLAAADATRRTRQGRRPQPEPGDDALGCRCAELRLRRRSGSTVPPRMCRPTPCGEPVGRSAYDRRLDVTSRTTRV